MRDKETEEKDYKERNRRRYIPDKNHFLSFYALNHLMIDDHLWQNKNPKKKKEIILVF